MSRQATQQRALWIFVGMVSILGTACTTTSKPPEAQSSIRPASKILVIGHRGASGHRPEHTLASYNLAIDMGADFIEPDLVATKDGVLIARHENEISGTTDVAIKFPTRKKTKSMDGVKVTGWFTEDFTLKELKTLRAKERLPSRDQSYNGKFQIPTFSEVLELAAKRSREIGREIGVYPETKHPTYFSSIGQPLEPLVAKELKRVGWDKKESPVIVQSFELSSLRRLKDLIGCRLVYLLEEAEMRPFDGVIAGDPRTYGDYTKPEELKKLSTWLFGIGPYKRLIVPADKNGKLMKPTSLIEDAHRVGLSVHAYTFRGDQPFLAKEYEGNPGLEYKQFFDLGVDGVFSDFPDQAVRARSQP